LYNKETRKVKFYITIKLIAMKIIGVSFLSLGYYFYSQYSQLNDKLLQANYELLELEKKVKFNTQVKSRLVKLEKNTANAEVEQVIKFFSKLKELYQVEELDFTILNNPINTEIYGKKIKITKAMLKFNSSSDEVSYQFFDSFFHNFPTEKKVENFHLVRGDTNLVHSKIIFSWYSYEN
jgi:hypothetical protein